MCTYLLVAVREVWPLAEGEHLPEDDAVGPGVALGRELAELDALGGHPPDRKHAVLSHLEFEIIMIVFLIIGATKLMREVQRT